MVEDNEQPFAAACREVREETGISELAFPWGQNYFETLPYNRGKVARYYLAATSQREVRLLPNPEIGRPEHAEYRWVSFDEAMRLATPRVQSVLDWVKATLAEPIQ